MPKVTTVVANALARMSQQFKSGQIYGAGAPPTAVFSSTVSGFVASFVDASIGHGLAITSWLWAFGDGATSTAQNPSHTYAIASTYAVTLTVHDSQGGSGATTNNVTVGVDVPRSSFAIMGQSNAPGFGAFASSGAVASTLIAPYPNVQICRMNAGNAQYPIPWVTEPAQPLAPRHTLLGNTTALGNMGMSLSLGRALDAASSHYDLIETGIGSASLFADLSPTSDASTQNQTTPSAILQMLLYVQQCVRDLRSPLAGIVWMQGETDATLTADASAYQVNLTALFNLIRTYFPNVPFVVVKINSNITAGFISTVQAAQAAVVAAIGNATLVNADDLALNGTNGPHYTADSYVTLGQRCAAALLALTPSVAVSVPAAGYSIDATSLQPKPFGPWEWGNMLTAAGITPTVGVTNHLRCQDLTVAHGGDGNLHDSNGGLIAVAANTGNGTPTLETVVSGWAAKGVSFTAGTGSGSKLLTASGKGYNTSTQSVFRFLRLIIPSAPSAERNILCLSNGTNLMAIDMLSSGLLKCYGGGVTVNSVNSHVGSTSILLGLRDNRTAGTLTMLSSLEKLAMTYSATSADGLKGVGDIAFGVHTGIILLDDVTFAGPDAEMTDAQVKSLYATFQNATIPWT